MLKTHDEIICVTYIVCALFPLIFQNRACVHVFANVNVNVQCVHKKQ